MVWDANSRKRELVAPPLVRLSYGPGFTVDEVVHDHEIASRSMIAVRHVCRVRAKRSVSRLDVDGRHKRRRELDADEREPFGAGWRLVHAQAVAIHAEQLDRR